MKEITAQTMKAIVDLWTCEASLAPKGLFYCLDGAVWVGCDNSDGNAWVEEFNTKEECVKWLLGDDEEDE